MVRRTVMLSVLVHACLLIGSGPLAAQTAGSVLRLGVLNDQSGPYSDASGVAAVEATRMAVADFGGSVLGRRVEVLGADHQNKADVGLAIARRWIDQENVSAILDVPNSAVALAVQQLTREKNRIALYSGAASSDLTGTACSPVGVQWTYDTYSLANSTAKALLGQGADSWFFLTADYAFGQALERDAAAFVRAAGGQVLGSARHPVGSTDFSSYLLQAQAAGAKVIGLANAGGDTANALRQGHEFGLQRSGQRFAGFLMFITDVHAVGLEAAQGLQLTAAFYWDMNPDARAWSRRFFKRFKRMPTMSQAGSYTSTLHLLRAIEAAGTDEARAVVAKMKELPINDFMAREGRVREDGRAMRDMYLFEVKAPAESREPWDYYRLVRTIPAQEAFRPMAEGGCTLVGAGK